MKHIFMLIFLATAQLTYGNVLILIPCSNRADLLEINFKTLAKFAKDDYQEIVFNDAQNLSTQKDIDQICTKYNKACVHIPQQIHKNQHPSHRHSSVIRYALNHAGFSHNGIVVLLDGDLFVVHDINFSNILGDAHIVGFRGAAYGPTGEIHLDFLWPAITILNMPLLPNKSDLDFSPGSIFVIDIGQMVGADTGASSYIYLKQHPNLKVKWLPRFGETWPLNIPKPEYYDESLGYDVRLSKNATEIAKQTGYHRNIGGYFWHYGGGKNVASTPYEQERTASMMSYINCVLNFKN